MFCTGCGYQVPEQQDFKFCPRCGKKIEVAVEAPLPKPAGGELLPQMQALADQLNVKTEDKRKRILIVEDDLFIRELYQKQLEMAGYNVDVAVDGLEGREKVLTNNYNLALLDIMLPRMNGLELLELIKKEPTKKDIPVIILSNLGQDSVVEKGLSLGAINYLVKADITPMEMLNVIQERIGK